MQVMFRDDIGIVVINVSGTISFDGQYAYFTDTEERNYKTEIKNIIEIWKEN